MASKALARVPNSVWETISLRAVKSPARKRLTAFVSVRNGFLIQATIKKVMMPAKIRIALT